MQALGRFLRKGHSTVICLTDICTQTLEWLAAIPAMYVNVLDVPHRSHWSTVTIDQHVHNAMLLHTLLMHSVHWMHGIHTLSIDMHITYIEIKQHG